jgi:hypothetical protein
LQLTEGQPRPVRLIEAFRAVAAYVLLGEAGSGKSMFERVAAALEKGARYSTVRYFLRKDVDKADRGRRLFIGAMDEQHVPTGRGSAVGSPDR